VASDVVVEVFFVFVEVAFVQPTSAGAAVGPSQEAQVGLAGRVEANG
jgi:hypothetical protein